MTRGRATLATWLGADPRAWARFRQNRGAVGGLFLVCSVIALSVVGPWIAPHNPVEQYREDLLHADGTPAAPLEVPGHPLGSDAIGRDELSRLLHGGTVSMQVAFFATSIALTIGLMIGVMTGYFRGTFDFLVMRGVDVLLSLPFLLIAIALRKVAASPSLWTLYVLLGLLMWTSLARITRAKVMQVRELEYILAARALGYSHGRILGKHVLPNVIGPAIVIGTTMVAQVIIIESAMSFLGIGVEAPQASWGSMLREGQEMLSHSPRLVLLPGLLILATVFGFNLFGDGLRDAFDPKERG